ncbi:MAG: lipid-A-disaccharide synthase N-terminal domain-containing protein [Elusimicrobia bacterium]|nr:lipid-A-disaccharide synthase N-terminal domain-containing protein [Elusimicrobiota bacterium]MDE2425128.1 lipid-A-disaccharide synthase N-terminal domain-containing protein [Elusimicrobiota bacterium]
MYGLWMGYVGAVAFAAAWVPQCVETLRLGRCDVNWGFLILQSVGSMALVGYSIARGDMVFCAVNVLATIGALLNLAVKLRSARRLAA